MNCKQILFGESSEIQIITGRVLKQFMVTVAVVEVCWPYETWHLVLFSTEGRSRVCTLLRPRLSARAKRTCVRCIHAAEAAAFLESCLKTDNTNGDQSSQNICIYIYIYIYVYIYIYNDNNNNINR